MLRVHVRTLAARGALLASLLVCAAACEGRSSEQTREVVDEAARTAERGVEHAKRGLGEARDEAREGIANARDRWDVDDKVAGARRGIANGWDEAAQEFAALGEAGRAHAEALGDKLDEAGRAGLEVAPDAVICTDEPSRVCKIDPELIAKLTAEPKLLVGEVSLWPKRGATGQGLQLVRLRAQSLTTMLGLREGDILLSVNGAELGSFDAIRALDQALAGKHEATLVYERDGQRGELTLMQQSP